MLLAMDDSVRWQRVNVEDLMREAFAPGREPRSNEYKGGVRASLRSASTVSR